MKSKYQRKGTTVAETNTKLIYSVVLPLLCLLYRTSYCFDICLWCVNLEDAESMHVSNFNYN